MRRISSSSLEYWLVVVCPLAPPWHQGGVALQHLWFGVSSSGAICAWCPHQWGQSGERLGTHIDHKSIKDYAIGEGIRIGINLSFRVARDRVLISRSRLLCFKLVICLSGHWHWVARRLATKRTCYCTPWACQGSMRLRSSRRGRFSPELMRQGDTGVDGGSRGTFVWRNNPTWPIPFSPHNNSRIIRTGTACACVWTVWTDGVPTETSRPKTRQPAGNPAKVWTDGVPGPSTDRPLGDNTWHWEGLIGRDGEPCDSQEWTDGVAALDSTAEPRRTSRWGIALWLNQPTGMQRLNPRVVLALQPQYYWAFVPSTLCIPLLVKGCRKSTAFPIPLMWKPNNKRTTLFVGSSQQSDSINPSVGLWAFP